MSAAASQPLQVITPEQAKTIVSEFYIHHSYFINCAKKMFTDRDNNKAEELVSALYERLCLNIDKYIVNTNAKAYGVMMMKNMYINLYRKDKRVGRIDSIDTLVHHPSVSQNEWIEVSEEVEKALCKLTPKEFSLVQLDIQDYKMDEIAEALQMPVNTVKSTLHRTKNTLALSLKTFGEKEYSLTYKRK